MDDAWESLLVIVGAVLAALLGGGLVNAVLARRTGRETVTATRDVGELAATTARLQTTLGTLEAEVGVLRALYESAAAKIDVQADELATVHRALTGLTAEHADCLRRLAAVERQRGDWVD